MMSRISTLKNQSAKKINLEENVKTSFFEGKSFPLVITPIHSGYNLKNWFVENNEKFEKDLTEYGAILFRDFNINSVEKFQDLMSIFPKELLEYKFRSSPRFELVENVYVSTTYPEDEVINMHSENSYAAHPPHRIVFCCITAAEYRGETPIADNRQVLNHISTSLRKKFEEKGVLYRRNLNGILGLAWKEVFQTSDKSQVEEECRSNGIDFQWVNEDELVLKWRKDAIWEHPVTKEFTWFNHCLFFNKYMLDDAFLKSISSDDELPNNTFFGDGSEISKEEIEELRLAYKKATIEFEWISGDVLFLDNFLISHGRNPYKGARKIIVSIS
jgi:alpha-ketoglutarate-dependent taurine dioxygenase